MPPTTADELRKAIVNDFPAALMSERAYDEIQIGELTVRALHRVWTSNGVQEPSAADSGQIYFSEREAVVAAWYNYRKWFTERVDHHGFKPLVLLFRMPPEVHEQDGIFRVRMRFSTIWNDRFNQPVTA